MSFYSEISLFYEKLFPVREQTLNFLLSYINGKSLILDIGCGTGSYVREISRNGNQIIGIDINKEMILEAKRQCPTADFIVGDILELKSNLENFEIIYSIGNVLSYFSKAYLIEAVSKIEKLLAAGGYWIFQIVNWDKILTKGVHSFPEIEIEEESIIFKRKYNSLDTGLFEFVLSVWDEKNPIAKECHILTPHTSSEIISLHNKNFELFEHFGNFKKDGFSFESPANIFIFRKKN